MARSQEMKQPPESDFPVLPVGLKLEMRLQHKAPVSRMVWSPDGELLAIGSDDGYVSIWKRGQATPMYRFRAHANGGVTLSWSPDGTQLASGAGDDTVHVWEFPDGEGAPRKKKTWAIENPARRPNAIVMWIPDGTGLICAVHNCIYKWNFDPASEERKYINDYEHEIWSVTFSPDGAMMLLCGSAGAVIYQNKLTGFKRFPESSAYSGSWSPLGDAIAITSGNTSIFDTQLMIRHLIEHDMTAYAHAWSLDGRLLAVFGGRNGFGRLEFWDTGRSTLAAFVQFKHKHLLPVIPPGMASNPRFRLFASLASDSHCVAIFSYDTAALLSGIDHRRTTHYMNAKVVLVGNTSVGKSGLGLVLAGRKFRATESTHGRHVWPLNQDVAAHSDDAHCEREVLLWDLAGQPGYRLIHQLYLSEVAVAMVLFDSRSETDPFAGVAYWARALDEATQGFPLVKLLVASRIDRGGPSVSSDRIAQLQQRYGFAGFLEVSAKRGDGIADLRERVLAAINWARLPQISSSEVFKATKDFLIKLKKQGSVLMTAAELLDKFSRSAAGRGKDVDATLLNNCLGQLQVAGLVRRLSFGDHVLLEPELLDGYCGWLAFAARGQPDGLGFVKEEEAKAGRFDMDKDRRLRDRPEEKTLLVATVEEVVARNVAYRQETERGAMLVFPSELNADLSEYPGGYSLAVGFSFEGPLSGIYATLAVSLINSTAFKKKDLYKNAALFLAACNQICGFAVHYPDKSNDSLGYLVVFFHSDVDKSTRLLFLRYVNRQLERLALENTVRRERIYHCASCDHTISQDVIAKRRARQDTTVICAVCQRHFPLDDLAEQSAKGDEKIEAMEASALAEQERQRRLTTLDERRRSHQYHVFLCHNTKDKPIVKQIAQRLMEQGVLPWFDEKAMLGGDRFSIELEDAIRTAGAVAIFIGPQGMGRWQKMEYHAALVQSLEAPQRTRLRLIPVLLPGVPKNVELPLFLSIHHAVDLRDGGADVREGITRLVSSILADGPAFGDGMR